MISRDNLNYLPIVLSSAGVKPSTAAMYPLKHEDKRKNRIFQIPESIDEYKDVLDSKTRCRYERLSKYYTSTRPIPKEITKFIIDTLASEYPSKFDIHNAPGYIALQCNQTNDKLFFSEDYKFLSATHQFSNHFYTDELDALASQIPEDLVIHRIEDGNDLSTNIHLCYPNGWAAEWAIGRSFEYIHRDVPRIEKIIPDSLKLVKGIVNMKNPRERVGAISFRTDHFLNRHPNNEYTPSEFDPQKPELYMRFERQVVVPFPSINSFLFTIRTYFVDCSDSTVRPILLEALKNDHSKAYSGHFLDKHKDSVIKWLNNLESQ